MSGVSSGVWVGCLGVSLGVRVGCLGGSLGVGGVSLGGWVGCLGVSLGVWVGCLGVSFGGWVGCLGVSLGVSLGVPTDPDTRPRRRGHPTTSPKQLVTGLARQTARQNHVTPPPLPQRSYIAKSGRELFLKSRLGYDQPLAQGPGEARHRVAAAPGATVSGTVLQHTWTSWGPRCSKQRGSAS